MKKNLFISVGLASIVTFNMAAGKSVPFMETFNSSTFPEGWITIDANSDGYTWKADGWKANLNVNYGFNTFEADDWLITPAITLEKDKSYLLSFFPSVVYNFSDPNSFPYLEVGFGDQQSIDGLSIMLLEDFPVNIYEPQYPTRVVVTPDSSGDFYFGFHCYSPLTAGMTIDNVSVEEAKMPAAVTEIKITKNGGYGTKDLKISFRAPATDASGNPLPEDGLSKISIIRSGWSVMDVENPKPGEMIEIDDRAPYDSGNYVWKFVPYDSNGQEGITAESENVFVGVNVPANPVVYAVENGHTGEVTISWDPVTKDRAGEDMPADFIDYQIVVNGDYVVSTGGESPYTFQACESGDQTYLRCSVLAKSSYGSGTGSVPTFVVGEPYTVFSENFDSGLTHHNFEYYVDIASPAYYSVYDDSMLEMMLYGLDAKDADGTDGSFIFYHPYEVGVGASIGLGKFDVSGLAKPALSFYVFVTNPLEDSSVSNLIALYATKEGESEENLIGDLKISEFDGMSGWKKVSFPLDELKGTTAVLRLHGLIGNIPWIVIDHISFGEILESDLNLSSFKPSQVVTPGEEASFSMVVENSGIKDFPKSDGAFFANGQQVKTIDLPAIKSGEFATVEFHHTFTLLDGDKIDLEVRLLEEDDFEGNNSSGVVTIDNKVPNYPEVTDLVGLLDENGEVILTWSEPSGETPAEIITESFEDAKAGDREFAGWTFIDNDGLTNPNYDELPGFDDGYSGPFISSGLQNEIYGGHSGDKAICFIAGEGGANDDWVISPKLSGEPQTISFFVKGYDIYGFALESFRFLTSESGNEMADFQLFETNQTLDWITGKNWTYYSFDVPEGTRYFAIKYCTDQYSGMALFVDDITFAGAESAEPLELTGYKVYRRDTKDGQVSLLTDSAIEVTSYIDSKIPGGSYIYQVTAVYTKGESVGSNQVVVDVPTGIKPVQPDNISIVGIEGAIKIMCDTPSLIRIHSMDGKLIENSVIEGTRVITLPGGVYMVSTPGYTYKIIVK